MGKQVPALRQLMECFSKRKLCNRLRFFLYLIKEKVKTYAP